MIFRVLPKECASGALNMATDEMLLSSAKEPILRIYDWQEPTISIGRLQKISDIQHIIPVIRRPTGGRAVYHDSTTEITYAIVKKATDQRISYLENCQLIIDILKKLDIQATLQKNGDITVKNKKISGNAQIYQKGVVLQHGTLLIEKQEYLKVAQVLKISNEELEKKTTYINNHLTTTKKEVEKLFLKLGKEQELQPHEKNLRDKLLQTKYQTREWNEGGTVSKGACYTT